MISQASFNDFLNYIMYKKEKKLEKLTKKELSNGLKMIKDEVENKLYFFISKELNKCENEQKIINIKEMNEIENNLNYNGWKIEILKKKPENKIIPLSYDSVLNGNFQMEIYSDSYLLSNIGFQKHDKLKKHYKKVQLIKDFIPKFHSNTKNEIEVCDKYFNIIKIIV
jgi:hypothetical protein